MKMAFFASVVHGRFAGFSEWRPDGNYQPFMETEDDAGNWVPDILLDVLECATWNDARRHANYLADFGPEDGVLPEEENFYLEPADECCGGGSCATSAPTK